MSALGQKPTYALAIALRPEADIATIRHLSGAPICTVTPSQVTYTAEIFRRPGDEDETTRFPHDRCSSKFAAADNRVRPKCLASKNYHYCGAVSGGRIG